MRSTVRLKRVARISYGLGQPPVLSDAGIPILRATNIERGKLVAKGLIFAAREALPLDRAPLLNEGEILVVRSGAYTGDSALVTAKWEGSAPGYDLRVSPNHLVESRYVAFTLLSSRALDEMKILSSRAAQPHLNAEELGEVSIDLPELGEQRAIANYLDTETARIDAVITKKRRMIELLTERLRVQARTMLTGQPTSASWMPGPHWLGPVPRSWQPHKISWRKITASGTTPESGNMKYYSDIAGTPWITTSELRETVIHSADRHVTDAAFACYSALKVFPAGTILIAMYGATVGRLGILAVPASTNQACCAIYGGRGLDQQFLYWWLWAHRDHIIEMAYGSGQPNISQEVVRGLRVPAPGEIEQRLPAEKVADEFRRVETAKRTLRKQIDLLTEHRQALITAAVTGELEIPGTA